jgi:H+-translocating NAD(P) transhydrogenase subunit alpha
VGEAITWLTIFVLAAFVGIEVISKVSSTLHTPLMSGANAIHGVILVGAIAVAGTAESTPVLVLSLIAVVLAAINMAGGFVVTDRMLQMFTRKPLRGSEKRGALRARPVGSVESSPPSSGRFDGQTSSEPSGLEPRSEQ